MATGRFPFSLSSECCPSPCRSSRLDVDALNSRYCPNDCFQKTFEIDALKLCCKVALTIAFPKRMVKRAPP